LTQNWVNFAGLYLELQEWREGTFGTHLKIEKSDFQWHKNQVNRSSFSKPNLAPKSDYQEPGETGRMDKPPGSGRRDLVSNLIFCWLESV